jgi:hypothetical protein
VKQMGRDREKFKKTAREKGKEGRKEMEVK